MGMIAQIGKSLHCKYFDDTRMNEDYLIYQNSDLDIYHFSLFQIGHVADNGKLFAMLLCRSLNVLISNLLNMSSNI